MGPNGQSVAHRRHQQYTKLQVVYVVESQFQLLFQNPEFDNQGTPPGKLEWHVQTLITAQILVSQIFFTPIFNSYFFGMQSLLSGASFDEIVERIKNTVPTSWINSCKFWPAVTAFSFTYVPIQYRSIFGGVIAIGWQTYLNLLNQRAAAQELAEHQGHARLAPPAATIQEQGEGVVEKQKCAA